VGVKSGAPDAQCTYSPSQNHNWCTPREVAPEQSKNEIDLGFSGTEMSNSSMPAGCSPFFCVW
jgi:hypothetical protein